MKRILIAVSLLIASTGASFAQVKMPAPSPVQTLKQDFGLGNIELTYSRPSAKGRKVFGDLVPMDKLWRTGANAPVKIVFSEPVNFGGKRVDSGTYVLYTIPGEDSWEIIINKGLKNWGTDGYKESEDVARVKVNSQKTKLPIETFTMEFTNLKADNCDLEIKWENTIASVHITADFRDKLRGQIEAAIAGDKKPYWQAAQFYNEYDKNLPKALENVTKAVEANPKAYWIWIYKARIERDMGDKAAALKSSQQSLTLAKESNNDDYVKLNLDLQKELKQ